MPEELDGGSRRPSSSRIHPVTTSRHASRRYRPPLRSTAPPASASASPGPQLVHAPPHRTSYFTPPAIPTRDHRDHRLRRPIDLPHKRASICTSSRTHNQRSTPHPAHAPARSTALREPSEIHRTREARSAAAPHRRDPTKTNKKEEQKGAGRIRTKRQDPSDDPGSGKRLEPSGGNRNTERRPPEPPKSHQRKWRKVKSPPPPEKNRKKKKQKEKEKNTHLHNLTPPALLVLHEVDGLDDVDVVEGRAAKWVSEGR